MGLLSVTPRYLIGRKAAYNLTGLFKISFGLSKGWAPNYTRRTRPSTTNKTLIGMHGYSTARSFSPRCVQFSSKGPRIGSNNKPSRGRPTTSL